MIAWLRGFRPHAGRRHAPVAEGVEPRLLFSADLAGGLMLGADAAAAAEVRTLAPSGEYAPATSSTASASTLAATYAALPMSFEANQGQAAAGIDFVAHGGGYGVALHNGHAWLTLATESGERTV
ncbi:MAG TPA: LEPR-XLL domain-containing protein, partial [Ramlibacter sp.]|nr:LEPR-XLL domain-containing protein [Ramlibacter sp.]